MKNVLITGGSGGLGLELAKTFVKNGCKMLVIVSLNQKELDDAKISLEKYGDTEIIVLKKDLSEKDAPKKVYDFVKSESIKIDTLVNNAGVGLFGFFNEIAGERELKMLKLNILATYELTILFLRDMTKANYGAVLNVASIAGLFPTPKFSAYAASKAFITNYSQAINYELGLLKSEVYVSVLCPPAIRTRFQQTAGMEKLKLFDTGFGTMLPEHVAKVAYKKFLKRKKLIIPSFKVKVVLMLMKYLPITWSMKLCEWSLK